MVGKKTLLIRDAHFIHCHKAHRAATGVEPPGYLIEEEWCSSTYRTVGVLERVRHEMGQELERLSTAAV